MNKAWNEATRIVLLSAVCSSALVAVPAMAQETAADETAGSDEIVVTARKRAETLLDVPLAVTAVTEEKLERLNIQNVDDLYTRVPGLFKAPGSLNNTSDFANLTIRGVGFNAGLEPAVGVFIDGMYQPQVGFDTAFLDLERVEVLRGPQGTLFGRNTQGGAVSLVTRKPGPEWRGKLRMQVAEFGTLRAQGAVSGPVDDRIYFGVAADYSRSDGYIYNVVLDQHQNNYEQYSMRGVLRFNPAENLDIVLSADASRNDFNEMIRGVRLATRRYESLIDNDTPDSKTNRGAQLNIDYKLSDNISLTSITGYRKSASDISSDSDSRITIQNITIVPGFPPLGIPDQAIRGATIDQQLAQRFVSQELRLSGETESFDWLAGAYYFDQFQNQDRQRDVGLGVTFPFALYIREDYADTRDGYALFGQASWRPIENLELTGGMRWSNEEVAASGERVQRSSTGGALPVSRNRSASFDNVSFMGSIGYQIVPDLRVYATVAQGWKAGGINRFPTGITGDLPYKEETSVNYELGVKSRLGRIGNFNLALYQIDIENQQLTNIIPGIPTPISTIDNAASSRVRGVEAELNLRPVENFEIGGSIAYSKSRFNNYIRVFSAADRTDFSGDRFENVPEVTANASLLYRIPVGGDGNRVEMFGEYSYVSSIIFQDNTRAANSASQISAPGYDRVNLKISYVTDNEWTFSAFVNNLFDTFDYTYASSDPFLGGDTFVAPLPPRQFGIVVSKTF